MARLSIGQLQRISLVILDVDGVLTDGGIYYGEQGQTLQRFHVHDGQGIKVLQKQGIEVVIVTSHSSEAVSRRAQELGIVSVYQGVVDKATRVSEIIQERGLSWGEVAYVGDDVTDLPIMERVGLPIAVANAVDEVKRVSKCVTSKSGGQGAVREVCDILLQRPTGKTRVVGVIPARYASTRFVGKPLAIIKGKPMIYHVYQRARASCLDDVIIATDDDRVVEVCQQLGCDVRLTLSSHKSGTERVAEIARDSDADIWINIQGDEPLIPPALINSLVNGFIEDPFLEMATARTLITDVQDISNRNIVKVIVDHNRNALYFSRAAIPHYYNGAAQGAKGRHCQYYKHIGIYGYRRSILLHLAQLTPTPLELSEALEQLRALEHGIRIKVIDTDYQTMEVNTPEDLERLERLLNESKEAL